MADFKAIMAEIKQPLWDNWYIVEELGSGASSVVYRIEARRENRTDVSALKVEPITLDDVLFNDPAKKASVLEKKRQAAVNETSIMYKLKKCPYIVGYEDENIVRLEHTDGYVLLIRMEYLTCLQDLVKRGGFDRSEANVVKLAMEIGSGIQAAHKQGVIHRDVKPANFFVSDDGTYKLGDFNISKSTAAARSFAGTEGYIAPEIYRAKQSVDNTYTKQADIYSFGICLYQLLNDFCFPFEDNCLVEEAIDRRMNGETLPLPKNASPELGRLILKACAYEPADRYQSMDEFLNDLRNYSIRIGAAGAIPVMAAGNLGGGYSSQSSVNQSSFNQGTSFNQGQPFPQNRPQNPFSTASMNRSSDATTYVESGPSAPQRQSISMPQPMAAPPKKKSKLPIVIALVAALAIGCAVVVPVLLGRNSKKSSEDKEILYPDDAVEYNGHHYLYYNSHKNWKDAEAYCVENGGHLASVNSSGEKDFLVELTKSRSADLIWIGGYCIKDDMDTWYWTDDSDFKYKNWAAIENYDGSTLDFPMNMEGNCYYLCYYNTLEQSGLTYGSWIDLPNAGDEGDTSKIGFVCEWD